MSLLDYVKREHIPSTIPIMGKNGFQVRLDTNWREYSAFLVTVHNRMDLHTTCATIGALMTFTSKDESISVGCVHYLVIN